MAKLTDVFKNAREKWSALSSTKKISYSVLVSALIIALVVIISTLTATKYAVLFSNLADADSGAVVNNLKESGVDYKISGDTILVPEAEADELKMKLVSEITFTGGSKGFEIFDDTGFGMTDEEMKIDYQIALQGELERTITSFSEVSWARVHLVIPSDTVFVLDDSAASASVTIGLKSGSTLSSNQIKGIIALLTGSVKNLSSDNVEIIDSDMNLLSSDLSQDGANVTQTTEENRGIEGNFEESLENDIQDILEAVYGKGNVKVKVNADLNFDSTQKSIITYDPDTVIRSIHTIDDGSSSTTSDTSASPVDDNMVNDITTDDTTTAITDGTGYKESTINNEVGQTEENIIQAPGEINRLTTSVIIDGELDDATKASLQNIVANAIGYNEARGDSISVEAMTFDTTLEKQATADIASMNTAIDEKNKISLYKNIAYGVGGFSLFVFILIRLRKRKKTKAKKETASTLNVVVGDTVTPKEAFMTDADFEGNDESSNLEREIKKYATKKPDQVVDVIKSWLAEDER